jgi:hypothetical protein
MDSNGHYNNGNEEFRMKVRPVSRTREAVITRGEAALTSEGEDKE